MKTEKQKSPVQFMAETLSILCKRKLSTSL